MRQKELRIALICYGGVSLAVYMHGVTKELWTVLKASHAFWSEDLPADDTPAGSEKVYRALLQTLERDRNLKLRVIVDILAGASAGGINGIFLAQAIHTGQSLEPLTQMWLECADVDVLLDPDARPWSKAAKFWAAPIVAALLHRPGNAVSASVAPETREEVREKLSRLIRSRWFEPPFSGIGFSRLLGDAFTAMAAAPAGPPLLPDRHPIDVSVTATDFHGHPQALWLHSPRLVMESEHRLPIRFSARRRTAGPEGQQVLGSIPELVFAARATASFPGAFPPLVVSEIDELAHGMALDWPDREAFLSRTMPSHVASGTVPNVALIDGSVLVNAPFSDATSVLRNRPAAREVDRRFVYIDPVPDRGQDASAAPAKGPGFFPVIFGSLSGIPREQPIRDNLEMIERQSREMADLQAILAELRPEVDETVERLFGGAFFLDWPTPRRIASWRAKAQQQAFEQSGFAYQGYARVKFNAVVTALARLAFEAAPHAEGVTVQAIAQRLFGHLAAAGLDRMRDLRGGTSPGMAQFLRSHDLDFRIRRLRLLARRVTQDWEQETEVSDAERDAARASIYAMLAGFLALESAAGMEGALAHVAGNVLVDPGAFLDHVAASRNLTRQDEAVDAMLCEALSAMPPALRRRVLLTFLGFPFYDTATLPLFRGEGFNESDPIKVDRISPQDCNAIRAGGAAQSLRGTEFYNFGAFFSRAYRENDYLWGRLQGAERMVDLIASTLDPAHALAAAQVMAFKKAAFLAILEEEEGQLRADPGLIAGLREEVGAIA